MKNLSPAALSIFCFGCYMITFGSIFALFANQILPLFGFPPDHQPWIVVLCGIIAILGGYYVVAAKYELTPFFWATIPGRILVMCVCVLVVIRHGAPWQLILFAVPDQFGALWTYLALTAANR